MQLAKFFSFFYFSINAGSLIATWAMPLLREDVHCFGDLSCFSLAFGVPGVLMVISIIVFVAGRSLYVNKQPEGNVIVKVSGCVLVRNFFEIINANNILLFFIRMQYPKDQNKVKENYRTGWITQNLSLERKWLMM